MKKNTFLIMLYFFTVILFFLITASYTFAAGWLIFKKPAYNGKVIDAETKEPIEGAVVVAVYEKRSLGIVESYSVIIEVKEVVTDKNGVFHIPAYTTLIQPLSWGSYTTFIIFKPGYGKFPEYRKYPPKGIPLDVLEEFFIGETGKEGELVERNKCGGDIFNKCGEEILNRWKVIFGIVELPMLKTWEERNKANMISISDIPKSKWSLLHEIIEKEEKWLKNNKGWRR